MMPASCTGKISCKYNCRAMPDGHKRLLLDDDAVYHRSRKEINYTVMTISTGRDAATEEIYLDLFSRVQLAGIISLII